MCTEVGGHREGDAAFRLLGPLFRVTEVFLWDDASAGISKSSTPYDSLPQPDSAGHMRTSVAYLNADSVVVDAMQEDLDLARQMDALGLPTSFKTNKEQKRDTNTGEKRRGVTKPTSVYRVKEQVPAISTLAESMDEVPYQVSSSISTISHTCENLTSHFITEDTLKNSVQSHTDSVSNNQGVAFLGRVIKEEACSGILDAVEADIVMDYTSVVATENCNDAGIISDAYRSSNFEENEVKNSDHLFFQGEIQGEKLRDGNLVYASALCCPINSEESSIHSNSAEHYSCWSTFDDGKEWGTFWDAFYMRNYYYNFFTQESTWFPPFGLEQSGLLATPSESNPDVTEEGTNCEFDWNSTYHEGYSRETSSTREAENDGVSASDEFVSSDMHLLPFGGSYNKFDKIFEHPTCSETWNSTDEHKLCETPYCSLDMLEQVDRLTVSHDTNVDEKWSLQPGDEISMLNDLHGLHHVHVGNCNRKQKVKHIKLNQKILSVKDKGYESIEMIHGLPTALIKYWYQRYSLFSKFDLGVKVDEEGWFSVTPEAIARHHASRCGHGTVIDAFTGIGGNAIQFALKGNHVIAIDIDPQKVDFAQHNSTIYGVGNNIDFVKGDSFILVPQMKADTLFMSPPWGGPDYSKVQVYDIKSMLKPHNGYFLFKMAVKIASVIIMFLPRNVDINQLAELSLLVSPPWELEVERNYLNGRLKAVTAYFRQPSKTETY